MLAYYVEWHMRRAWAPLLFAEDDPQGAAGRRGSAVQPGVRSQSAEHKASAKTTPDGETVHRGDVEVAREVERVGHETASRCVGIVTVAEPI